MRENRDGDNELEMIKTDKREIERAIKIRMREGGRDLLMRFEIIGLANHCNDNYKGG